MGKKKSIERRPKMEDIDRYLNGELEIDDLKAEIRDVLEISRAILSINKTECDNKSLIIETMLGEIERKLKYCLYE